MAAPPPTARSPAASVVRGRRAPWAEPTTANPLPVVVPCHRVIGAGGSLTGYAGGLRIKRFLLELEAGNASRAAA